MPIILARSSPEWARRNKGGEAKAVQPLMCNRPSSEREKAAIGSGKNPAFGSFHAALKTDKLKSENWRLVWLGE
jgi:hypothetical protein